MRASRLLRQTLGFAIFTIACDDATPIRPSSVRPPPSQTAQLSSGARLSGVVYEATTEGLRPLAGVPLDISVEYQAWPPLTTSDGAGRYSVSGLSTGNLKVRAEMQGYSQPCRAAIALTGDGTLDVFLVSDVALSTKGAPGSMPIAQPIMSGTVNERTSRGLLPLVGVRLTADFSAGFGWAPSATTLSDSAGRYVLCGVTNVGHGVVMIAGKQGYVGVSLPVTSPDASFDIELVRR
jgi:hypothetical protein